MEDSWMVGQAKPLSVDRAADNAKRQDAEVYTPKYLVEEIRAGRVVSRTQPLFGSYFFVRTKDGRWRHLLGTFGFLRVLMTGEIPALVNDAIISTLRQREDEDGYMRLPLRPRFVVGGLVRIEHGCFADREAIYCGSDSLERERVLLNIMGRMTPLSVGAGSLVPV